MNRLVVSRTGEPLLVLCLETLCAGGGQEPSAVKLYAEPRCLSEIRLMLREYIFCCDTAQGVVCAVII